MLWIDRVWESLNRGSVLERIKLSHIILCFAADQQLATWRANEHMLYLYACIYYLYVAIHFWFWATLRYWKKSHRERTQPAAATRNLHFFRYYRYGSRLYDSILIWELRGPRGSIRNVFCWSFHGILLGTFPNPLFRFVMQLVSCTSSRFRERNCRKNHPGLIFPWLFEQMLKDMLTLKGIFKHLPTNNTRLFMQAFSSQRVNR